MHFEIIKETPPYQPILSCLPDYKQIPSIKSSTPKSANSSIIIENIASFAMLSHIGWDNHDIADNKVEQGGILIGEVYKDPSTEKLTTIAKFAIPAKNTKGSSVYLEITSDIWTEMTKHLDYINKHVASENLAIIGWYHTHPNSLDVFFSGTDRATQTRLFRQDWQIGVVLNPHKCIWTAFYGKDSHPTGGIIICPDTSTQKATSHSIIKSVQQDLPEEPFQSKTKPEQDFSETTSLSITERVKQYPPEEAFQSKTGLQKDFSEEVSQNITKPVKQEQSEETDRSKIEQIKLKPLETSKDDELPAVNQFNSEIELENSDLPQSKKIESKKDYSNALKLIAIAGILTLGIILGNLFSKYTIIDKNSLEKKHLPKDAPENEPAVKSPEKNSPDEVKKEAVSPEKLNDFQEKEH